MDRYVYVSGYGPASPHRNARLVEGILQAIRLAKRVRFSYRRASDGQVTEREVEPYGLLCRHGVWYLAGRCLAAGERRVFRLDHMERLDLVENSTYAIPEGFSLRDAYAHAWGVWTEEEPGPPETVRLRVSPGLAHKFRVTRYHESQTVAELPGGGLEVRFEVSGAAEMIPWLLGWGASLEVLEPGWLREELAAVLEETLGLYRKAPGPAGSAPQGVGGA
ncbi:MAG: WYL domain-containing protein [Clostridia bacterium]|nr:WYL domain-containing protein [Clostridia bacterium]